MSNEPESTRATTAPKVATWQERCEWNSEEPAVWLMHHAMKAEIAELRLVLAAREPAPAPVARELDDRPVYMERCGENSDYWKVITKEEHDSWIEDGFSDKVRAFYSRQATAESAPARAAPLCKCGKTIEGCAVTSCENAMDTGLYGAAPDEQKYQIPEGWQEQMQSIIKWLHDSVNTVGNTPDDHGYASEFDYNLSHVASTMEWMLKEIGILSAPSNTSPVGAKEQDK